MLTRRTSGATANPGSRLGGLLWRASSIGGETLVDVAGTTGTGFVVMGAFSVSKWPTVAADCVEIGGDCASCEPGNLHFPSASCGHTTVGFTSATSLITSLLEKTESKRTRSRNVFASRKFPGPPEELCAIVIPLSSSPPHGVKLMLRIRRLVPSRRLSSCRIFACAPCDCTYRFTPSKKAAPSATVAPNKMNVIRSNFCTL